LERKGTAQLKDAMEPDPSFDEYFRVRRNGSGDGDEKKKRREPAGAPELQLNPSVVRPAPGTKAPRVIH
ncbi:MAG: hypothetical protein ACREP3_16120, partial [Candidatus Binatia bacterium]